MTEIARSRVELDWQQAQAEFQASQEKARLLLKELKIDSVNEVIKIKYNIPKGAIMTKCLPICLINNEAIF